MSAWATAKAGWDSLAPREKTGLGVAALLVTLALLWWLALAPALQTLRTADAEAARLDAELQLMRSQQAQAQALQNQPKMSYDDALRALEASVKQRFGNTAQLNVLGDRATLTLRAANPEALAQWLTQARVNARAQPTEARLTRSPGSSTASSPTWDGSLVLSLPAR
jgi:general secretion pathway protein M